MTTFDQIIDRGHEMVVFHQDEASGLRAIVAVHSSRLGPGFGGARRWHYATEADALYDVLRLSEGMTWKAAVANVPIGGGKAVVLLPKHGHAATEREARALGRFIERLGGAYVSAEDVGLTPQYVDWMEQETSYVAGGGTSGGDPSPHTAQGVVNAMKAALEHVGRPVDFAGLHVAIQGAGNVGTNVARIVRGHGAEVSIADIDPDRARRAAEATGARLAEPDEILALECDILCPCALGGVLDATTIRRLRTGIVCGGANNILDDYDEDGVALQGRDIVYVPDFVANAGGLVELAGHYLGMSADDRRARIDAIEQNAREVLLESVSHPSTFAAAVAIAKRRIDDHIKEQVHAG